MAISDFAFDPVTGLENTVEFPYEPEDETAAREQFQRLLNQLKTYLNSTVKPFVSANIGFAKGVSVAPSTSSTSFVDVPDMEITLTTQGGDVLVIHSGTYLVNAAIGNAMVVALKMDSNAEITESHRVVHSTGALYGLTVETSYLFESVAAGSHTFKVRWFSGGAYDIQSYQTSRTMIAMEVKA